MTTSLTTGATPDTRTQAHHAPAGTVEPGDDERWQAVSQRAVAAGFVFAVTTTGIYCQSGCPARTPLRPNVRYFASAAAARAAGYRPCKRCWPTAGAAATEGRHGNPVS